MSFQIFSITETTIEQLTVLNGFSNCRIEVLNERDSNRSKFIQYIITQTVHCERTVLISNLCSDLLAQLRTIDLL